MGAVMKRKWVAVLMMALSAVPMMGCGTVRNLLSEHPQPYGGLASDVGTVSSSGSSSGPSQPLFPQGINGDPRALLLGLALVAGIGVTELCVTGVADTLCLPYFYLRDGELFPKDSRSDNTRDFSALPVQDCWPPCSLILSPRTDCVWTESNRQDFGPQHSPFADDNHQSKEAEDRRARSAKACEPPPFLSLRGLVGWLDGGPTELPAAVGQSSAHTWQLSSPVANNVIPPAVPPLPYPLSIDDLRPKGWPEAAKTGGVAVPRLAAHSFWEAQETAIHPVAHCE
jgi:hypothetical protein